MGEVDWIEQRIRCSVEHAWNTLRERLRADVQRWKELTRPEPGALQMTFEQDRLTLSGGACKPWIDLTRKRDHIAVRRPKEGGIPTAPDDVLSSRLSPSLNAEGECRLRWDGKEFEFWQVSRELLEPVLFAG
jgi:hypothetical protein